MGVAVDLSNIPYDEDAVWRQSPVTATEVPHGRYRVRRDLSRMSALLLRPDPRSEADPMARLTEYVVPESAFMTLLNGAEGYDFWL